MIRRAILPTLALALWSLPALAEHGEDGDAHPHEVIAERAEDLGIDDITVGEVLDIADAAREERDRLQGVVRTEQRTLKAMLKDETVDREAVMEQVEILGEAETEMRKHKLAVMLDMRSLLNEEQRAALKTLMGSEGFEYSRHSRKVRRVRKESSQSGEDAPADG